MTKLTTRLQRLAAAVRRTPNKQFDYKALGLGVDPKCGCVLVVAEQQLHRPLSEYLDGVDGSELNYIIGYRMPSIGPGRKCTNMTDAQAQGAAGKREAVRRINRVLSRVRRRQVTAK